MNISHLLLGATVLCALPTFAQPDVRPAARPLYPLVTLEEAAKLALSKPITLHVRDITVKEAIEEVARQTEVPIEIPVGPQETLTQKLSLDIETNSFKKATDAIFEEAGVKASIRKVGRSNRWGISWGEDPLPNQDSPTSGTAPFQIQIQNISTTTTKNVRLGKTLLRSQNTNLSADILFQIDPQLPLVGAPRLEITRAEDDQGRSLRNEDRVPFLNGDINFPQPIRLRSPEKGARSIAHLEGTATYVLAAKREIWEVPDVFSPKDAAHNFEAGVNTVRVSIVSVSKTNDGVQLDVAVDAVTPMIGALDEPRHPLLQFDQLVASIRLVDAQGNTLYSGGYSGSNGGTQLTGQLRYFIPRAFVAPPQNGEPAVVPAPPTLIEPLKLIIDAPSDLVQTEVPFSFSNLPLP